MALGAWQQGPGLSVILHKLQNLLKHLLNKRIGMEYYVWFKGCCLRNESVPSSLCVNVSEMCVGVEAAASH